MVAVVFGRAISSIVLVVGCLLSLLLFFLNWFVAIVPILVVIIRAMIVTIAIIVIIIMVMIAVVTRIRHLAK